MYTNKKPNDMVTRKTTVSAHTEPAPIEPTATGPITLPEMPPAATFQGLITYAVDTATNQSKQLPLDFLADGVAACIDATADAIEQTKATVVATEKATASATGADEAAEAARTEAANLAALKTAVANATADAVEKTQAAETAATNADTATKGANAAAADAVEKTQAAQTATNEANAAKDAAIEATENLAGDVSALVLTPANKPRIQELAGIDYSLLTEQEVPGEFWLNRHRVKKQVFTRCFSGTTPSTTPSGGKYYILMPSEASNIESAVLVYFTLRNATTSGSTYNTGVSNVSVESTSNFSLGVVIGPFNTQAECDQYANRSYAFAIKYIKP